MATSTLGAKNPPTFSPTKNVPLKLPQISLIKGYFWQFKGYIFAVLGQFFEIFRILGAVGHRGFAIVLTKECAPPPWHPSSPGLSLNPEVTEQKELWRLPCPLGKQGKRVYTIGPERGVYTIEASDPEKEKWRVSTVGVYTVFFPVPSARNQPKVSVRTKNVATSQNTVDTVKTTDQTSIVSANAVATQSIALAHKQTSEK